MGKIGSQDFLFERYFYLNIESTLFVFILALRLLKLYNLEFVLGTKGIIYVIVPHTKLVKDILDIEFSI